jgi:hypothetical protein
MENSIYFRFDKTQLTSEEKQCILALINNYDVEDDAENALYGLFDGYAYNNLPALIQESKIGQDRFQKAILFAFKTIWNKVETLR